LIDWLHSILTVAARVVSDTRKYDRCLSHLLPAEPNWLDGPQLVLYKLSAIVYRRLQ